jgi:hypothetical protein
MSRISVENVQALATKAYIAHSATAFGEAGANGIRDLLDCVKLIYQRFPAERVPRTLTVILGVGATPLSTVTQGEACRSLSEVGEKLSEASGKRFVVEIVVDGTYRTTFDENDVDLKALAKSALIYRLDESAERILAGDFEDFIPLISPVLRSNFSSPTLSSLEESLERYRRFARESKCRILKNIWEGTVDGPRLVLVNKPESLMRDSLAQALELMLQDATVKPEQNTDETKPVDIRVNWFASGAIALIEVKWLGKSTTAKSESGGGAPTYTTYTASRAQDGADQLADYLDREVRHSDATAPRGYLVVFDARRKGTKGAADLLSEADATAYEHADIQYDPDHSKLRVDFAPPVRFFLNPRKSLFQAAQGIGS